MHVDFNILSLLFLYVLDSVRSLSIDALTSVRSGVEWGGRLRITFLRFRSDLCDLHADPRVAVMVSPVLWSEELLPPPPPPHSSFFILLFPPPPPSPLLFSLPSFCLLFKCFHLFLMRKQSWSIVILSREEV